MQAAEVRTRGCRHGVYRAQAGRFNLSGTAGNRLASYIAQARLQLAQKALDDRIARVKRMDDMLYDDKLAGLISAERYMEKHESFASELKSLERQKGGVSQQYEEKYMKGIAEIE